MVQLKRATSKTFKASNPTLQAGQPGYETDTSRLKIGNGTSTWNALSYTSGTIRYQKVIDGWDVNIVQSRPYSIVMMWKITEDILTCTREWIPNLYYASNKEQYVGYPKDSQGRYIYFPGNLYVK